MTLIPAWLISLLFLLSAILCAYSAIRYFDWTGIIFAPTLLTFSYLYYYYTVIKIDPAISQAQISWGLFLVALVVLVWRLLVFWLRQ